MRNGCEQHQDRRTMIQTHEKWYAISDIHAPAIRCVCKESRDKFLQEYVRLGNAERRKICAYFNPQIDTVLLPHLFHGTLSSLASYLEQVALEQKNGAGKFRIQSLAFLHSFLGVSQFGVQGRQQLAHEYFLGSPRSSNQSDEFAALKEIVCTSFLHVISGPKYNTITNSTGREMLMGEYVENNWSFEGADWFHQMDRCKSCGRNVQPNVILVIEEMGDSR